MQVGRNDPCPCGSGKKYKKCCMRKDEEESRAAEKKRAESNFPPPPPRDPQVQAGDELWKTFEEAEYEEQIALFEQALADADLLDSELAFHMLSEMYPEALGRRERGCFGELIAKLRQALPDVYADDAHYYLDWLLVDALAAGEDERIPDIMREMAPLTAQHIDDVGNSLDRLAYHGRLSVLIETMRASWPEVKVSTDILPYGIDEFARQGFDCALFDYLEKHPSIATASPELLEQCEFFCESDPEGLDRYLAHLTGQAQREWSADDFRLKYRRPPRRDYDEDEEEEPIQDPGRQNLHDLTVEFLGYLRREEGIPYTKGQMARSCIHEYLLERFAGDLDQQEDMFERRERRPRRKPRKKLPIASRLLFLDRATLDRFLGGLLHFINPQYYKMAATFEAVPSWLRFLVGRGLLEEKQREEILREMRKLRDDIVGLLDRFDEDPALKLNVQQAWKSAV